MKLHRLHKPIGVFGSLCLAGYTSFAGTASYNFDTDPSSVLQLFGTSTWQSSDGNPASLNLNDVTLTGTVGGTLDVVAGKSGSPDYVDWKFPDITNLNNHRSQLLSSSVGMAKYCHPAAPGSNPGASCTFFRIDLSRSFLNSFWGLLVFVFGG